jgi:hypothetical protein
MSKEMPTYFVSYARKDGDFALNLARELRAAGANVWLDQLDILGGQHWDEAVEHALRSCEGMILVLSPTSVISNSVMDEVSYALDENKLVVPVLHSRCEIPFRLRRLHYIDLSQEYQVGFTNVLRALSIQPKPESTSETLQGVTQHKESRAVPERREQAVAEAPQLELNTHQPPSGKSGKSIDKRGIRKWLIAGLGAILAIVVGVWVLGGWDPIKGIQNVRQHREQFTEAQDLARKHYFFASGDDPWSNSRASGFPNQFRRAEDVVHDDGTGLTWQQGGSSGSIGHPEIAAYLRTLNRDKVGGYTDWRLPSLAEAWSLLEYQQANTGLHVDPAFGSEQTWIWTSTMTADGYGWFIFFESGRPVFQNAWQSHAYVRAVRGPEFR